MQEGDNIQAYLFDTTTHISQSNELANVIIAIMKLAKLAPINGQAPGSLWGERIGEAGTIVN